MLTVARVGLDVPLFQAFDFLVPQEMRVSQGQLVRVPFGRRAGHTELGIVLGLEESSELAVEKLKSIHSTIEGVTPIDTSLLDLFRFCSRYYQAPLGQVIISALPPALRNNLRADASEKRKATQLAYEMTDEGQLARQTLPKRADAMRLLLDALASQPRTLGELRAIHPRATLLVRQALSNGWLQSTAARLEDALDLRGDMPALTLDQERVVSAICQPSEQQRSFLLQGITGSGKTEVYLRLIANALERGEQTLLLVPEINLTPALLTQVTRRFPTARLAIAHSGMAAGARLADWLDAQSGEAQIVIGTRLAVFTPMPRLGLIIIDEEHDASFKQQDGTRYSARDLALVRAHNAKIPIVLGSATPSIESLDNAAKGRLQLIKMRSRAIASARLPNVEFVNLNAEKARDGLSDSLRRAISETLARGEQAMVFINRRGYAPALHCSSCGWMPECARCSARMVFYRNSQRLKCHHCGADARAPTACQKCGHTELFAAGQGSERIEDAVTTAFPDARVARVDRDSTRRRGEAERILLAAEQGAIDILVGTQMLAKGHDFPKLTLVGVVNADAAVFAADFRAAERMAQQLMQVAGRAGRADRPGRVIIQTRLPEHPVYQAVSHHDYDAFVAVALRERQLMQLPPFTYLALLRAEAKSKDAVSEFFTHAQASAKRHAGDDEVRVWEPIAATLERKAGFSREQMMIQAADRRQMQRFLAEWLPDLRTQKFPKVRWHIDVDPIEV
jgi:primosomal protein N' (replication factor Y)